MVKEQARLYLVASAFLSALAQEGYRLSISQSHGPQVDLGVTVTLTCTAYRNSFWKATDNIEWKKQQAPDDFVLVTTNDPDYATIEPFANRYKASAQQDAADTVNFKLTISDFQHTDSGTYQCLLVGENANKVSPQQVNLFTSLTAVTNLSSTAAFVDGVYTYSFTQQQETACAGLFFGTGNPQLQVFYADNEISNDFRESSHSYLLGSTVGLKQMVQNLTYTAASSFYPSTDTSSPLLCKALNDRGVVLSSSSINIRGQKKPSLICAKQDPATVVLGSPNVRVTCSLSDYWWIQNVSALSWTFTYNTGNGQLINVTLMSGDKGYNREAINDPVNPQLVIVRADDNAVIYNNYVISLTHGGITLATTSYKLKVDASQTKSASMSDATTMQPADLLWLTIFSSILTAAVRKYLSSQ